MVATLGQFELVAGVSFVRVRAPDLHVVATVRASSTAPIDGRAGLAPTTVGLAREALIARGIRPYSLLNGSMFSGCDPRPRARNESDSAYWARTTCERLGFRALDTLTRTDAPHADPDPARVGSIVAVVNGRFVVVAGKQEPVGATVAIEGYPTLVRDGVAVASADRNTDVTWRAALVVFDDTWGALADYRGSMRDFAERLVRMGARHAVYSDGGGSTRLMDAAGNWKGSSENRRVASVWFAAQSGNTGDGIGVRDAGGNVVVPPLPTPPAPATMVQRGFVGAAVGAAVGMVVGGPIGALIGAGVGGALGIAAPSE